MGNDTDEMAVLNTKLQVRGIKNLRVFADLKLKIEKKYSNFKE